MNRPLLVLLVLELLIYTDRGILPGCSMAINSFIKKSLDTNTPSSWLGFVQGSFLGGLSVASIAFAHANHFYSSTLLIIGGLLIWVIATVIVGISYYLQKGSAFWVLLFARTLSGVGEGALVSLVPPLILKHSHGIHVGIWMGVFCAILPVGTALGYSLGGLVSESLGWNIAFFFFFAVSLVTILLIIFFPRYFSISAAMNTSVPQTIDSECCHTIDRASPSGQAIDSESPKNESYSHDQSIPDKSLPQYETIDRNNLVVPSASPDINRNFNSDSDSSLYLDFKTILMLPEFLLLALAYASFSAVVIGFSTFGSAFLQGLNFVESELNASFLMGAIVAGVGLLGGLAGGGLTSLSIKKSKQKHADAGSERCLTSLDPSSKAALYRVDHIGCISLKLESDNSADKGIYHYSNLKDNSLSKVEDTFYRVPAIIASNSPVSPIFGGASKQPYDSQSVLLYMIPVSIIGTIFLLLTSIAPTFFFFVTFLIISLLNIFALQSGLNLSIMLVVPMHLRGLAIATSTFMLHALGDVPGSIIAGLVKDKLAPSCSVLDPDTGRVAEACFKESRGLRTSIFLIAVWLVWMILGIVLAYFASYRKRHFSNSNTPPQAIPEAVA